MDIIICHKHSIFEDIDVNCESFLAKTKIIIDFSVI